MTCKSFVLLFFLCLFFCSATVRAHSEEIWSFYTGNDYLQMIDEYKNIGSMYLSKIGTDRSLRKRKTEIAANCYVSCDNSGSFHIGKEKLTEL